MKNTSTRKEREERKREQYLVDDIERRLAGVTLNQTLWLHVAFSKHSLNFSNFLEWLKKEPARGRCMEEWIEIYLAGTLVPGVIKDITKDYRTLERRYNAARDGKRTKR